MDFGAIPVRDITLTFINKPAEQESDTMVTDNLPKPDGSIDDLIDRKIAAQLAPVVERVDELEGDTPGTDDVDFSYGSNNRNEVIDIANDVIGDYNFERTINDAIDNYMSYEFRFDPDDYDLVTDDALSSFREEIEAAIERLEEGVDPNIVQDSIDDLTSRLDSFESRIERIEEAINSFNV